MPDCIFCQIIKGRLPCAKVYEDDFVLSFLDINPINPGHTLVVPKNHYATLFETPAEELQACIVAAKKIAKAVVRGMGASGMNLIQNNHRSAGQLIDHIHFHLIPRHVHDGFFTSWPGKPYPTGEMERILKRIKSEA